MLRQHFYYCPADVKKFFIAFFMRVCGLISENGFISRHKRNKDRRSHPISFGVVHGQDAGAIPVAILILGDAELTRLGIEEWLRTPSNLHRTHC